ncbi:hypothetical protein NEMBOFW57_007045 [Staphylotrichum longicolle]|uniref:Uncharacterized protein n=1 Tax=Staphylotrichum longicolle TaxID=669026 RepID=A0AAD4ETX7_9PEZI|nr:hypothetical protein NEMBOFW57_007045 [Staphylotrichum longicolle]
MHFSTTNSLVFLGVLAGVCSAAPAPAEADPVFSFIDLPPSCIGFANGAIKTPSCYTATTTKTVVPTSCPKIKCAVPSDPIMCPMYIKVTSVAVPCSTDCCPKTPTATVTKKVCPTCTTGCVIPTETYTVTTGCKTTKTADPGPILTPSATFIVG